MQSRLFENEIRTGVLQSSVQTTCPLQEYQRHKFCSILFLLSGILAEACLFNAKLEHSRSNLVYEIRNDFIFEMLYCLQTCLFKCTFAHFWHWFSHHTVFFQVVGIFYLRAYLLLYNDVFFQRCNERLIKLETFEMHRIQVL